MSPAMDSWERMFAEVWPAARDLRNLTRETFDPAELIDSLKSAPVVLALYADGSYTIVKGTEELAELVSDEPNTNVSAFCCKVGNKSQAEMLAAILDLSEKYAAGIPDGILGNFARMFVVASRRGEAH